MKDRLDDIWELQAKHQEALGLAPGDLSEPARRVAATELMTLGHEEWSELGRRAPTHKRHVLRMPASSDMDLAEEVADVLKCVVAWSQLYGLSAEQIMEAFRRKTAVMMSRLESEKLELQRDSKLVCVDLDDVTVDIAEWRACLAAARASASSPADIQAAEERFKHDWNESGRFMGCPPVRGAPEALRRIKSRGYAIAYITARPQWQYKRLLGDTLHWLKEHGVPIDLLLFNKDKCEAIYHHIQPAWPRAFVEDHTRNAVALANIGVQVLLFDAPHNQDIAPHPLIQRVYSWDEVMSWLGIE